MRGRGVVMEREGRGYGEGAWSVRGRGIVMEREGRGQ